MSNHPLYKRAEKAVEEMFSDTSVSKATTKEALEELASQIDLWLDVIEADMESDNGED